ncbi:hypothetical protein EI94DRAFT_1698603 [Lactarius quietus]|nr:hypothetical protein EI94DRAFT_1698603 [Lactarius quietus]
MHDRYQMVSFHPGIIEPSPLLPDKAFRLMGNISNATKTHSDSDGSLSSHDHVDESNVQGVTQLNVSVDTVAHLTCTSNKTKRKTSPPVENVVEDNNGCALQERARRYTRSTEAKGKQIGKCKAAQMS